MTSRSIWPCHDEELTLSTAYNQYSIRRVQHTLHTAYTEYCMHHVLHHHKIDCLPLPASLSSLGRPCCTQFSTFPQLQVNQCIESQLPSRLPPKLPPPDWPPPCTPPISRDRGLQVHLQTHSIMASNCISTLARFQPLSGHDHGLEVHISNLTGSRPPAVIWYSPDVHEQSISLNGEYDAWIIVHYHFWIILALMFFNIVFFALLH